MSKETSKPEQSGWKTDGAPKDAHQADPDFGVYDAVTAGIVVEDAEGCAVYVNEAAGALLGETPQEIVGKRCDQLSAFFARADGSPLAYEDHPSTKARLTGKPQHGAILCLTPKGGTDCRWIAVDSIPTLDPDSGLVSRIVCTLHDITRYRGTEQTLGEREATLRSLLRAAPVGIGLVRNRIIEWINDHVAEMTGYSAEEICGHSSRMLYESEEEFQRVGKVKYAEIAIRGIGSVETRWVRKDGKVIDILLSSGALDPADISVGSVFTALDITAQKRSEQVMRYHLAFETAITLVSTRFINTPLERIDDEVNRALGVVGRLAEVDRAYIFLLRKDGSTIDRTHEWCADSIPPRIQDYQGLMIDDFPWFKQKMTNNEVVLVSDVDELPPEAELLKHLVQADGVKTSIDVPMLYRGKPLGLLGFDSVRAPKQWSETTVSLLRVVGDMLVSALDRKRAEEALRESERRIQEIVDSAPFGAHVYDLQPDGRLVFAGGNRSADGILGVDNSQFIGMTIEEAFPMLTKTEIPEAYRHTAETGELYESEHVEYSGEEIAGVYQIHAFRPAPNRVAVFFRDVTEQKRAEENRRQLEREMEEQKRQFYRETIHSVTEGKLHICDMSEIRPYVSSAALKVDVTKPQDVADSRHKVEAYLREQKLEGDRLQDFMVAVGEAITNALKHGTRGHVYAGRSDGSVWVAIADKGSGIESLVLPRAVLRRGYSTKPSLGLGYSIMLEVADRVFLKTDERGTAVVLEKQIEPPQSEFSLDNLPPAWETLGI